MGCQFSCVPSISCWEATGAALLQSFSVCRGSSFKQWVVFSGELLEGTEGWAVQVARFHYWHDRELSVSIPRCYPFFDHLQGAFLCGTHWQRSHQETGSNQFRNTGWQPGLHSPVAPMLVLQIMPLCNFWRCSCIDATKKPHLKPSHDRKRMVFSMRKPIHAAASDWAHARLLAALRMLLEMTVGFF